MQDVFHRVTFRDKLISVYKSVQNLDALLLDYFGFKKRNVFYKMKNSKAIMISRGGTADKYEIVSVFSGHEYPLELLPKFKDPVIFDLGAHIGSFSIYADYLYGKRSKIFSVEPEPENFNYLERNIKVNNFNNITAINAAVGSYNGFAFLNKMPQTDAHFITKKLNKIGHKCTVNTLDNLAGKYKIDLLKMDIEGGEYGLLSHTRTLNFLKANVSYIIMEYHDANKYNFVKKKLNGFTQIFKREGVLCFKNKNISNNV